jgi:hypothetical protein
MLGVAWYLPKTFFHGITDFSQGCPLPGGIIAADSSCPFRFGPLQSISPVQFEQLVDFD